MKRYVHLDFPPGMSANGTVYTNRNRWLTGDRVRWHNNALRPIGGWRQFLANDAANPELGPQPLDPIFLDPSIEAARMMLSWQTNQGTTIHAVGTNNGIYAFDKNGTTVFKITPTEFVPREKGVDRSDGYGSWFYGRDTYGTPRPDDEDPVGAFNWCFRTWGENLLASERVTPSALYEWQPVLANPATKLSNAPENFDCFHVTDQRIVMAAGSLTEPRLIQWSDSEDNNDWTPQLENQAGSQILPGIGKFKEIVTVQDRILLVSETDAYVARYLGPPYIYGFDKVGDDCGVAAGASVVATETFAIWPSGQDFFIFDGTAVSRIPCDVTDLIQGAINAPQGTKTIGFVNKEWGEIWWLYQSGSNDIDSYIFYDIKERHWASGTLDRTVGFGGPQLNGLLMIGSDGTVYEHEVAGSVPSDDDNASDVFVKSGPIVIADGNTTQFIDSIQPDLRATGEVDIFLIGQDRPTGPETRFGPFSAVYPAQVNQPIPARARGHTVTLELRGKSSTWTMGSTRLNFAKAGGMK